MRRDNIFWGAALILFGVLFLLQNQGIISNVFPFIWPLALILVGGWMVLGVFWKPASGAGETFAVPLSAAKSVHYKFSHGAAQIRIGGGAPSGQALVGTTATGMEQHSRLDGDRLEVRVETGPSFIPFVGPAQGFWEYQLTQEVPVTLTVEAGASTFEIDLRDVLASRVDLKVGASSVNVTLPARGVSLLEIDAGAASFQLRVPEATAARIGPVEGVTALNVDTNRFPRSDSGFYQSPNYESSPDRVDIIVKGGMASVNVN
jgi:hypothetical protein